MTPEREAEIRARLRYGRYTYCERAFGDMTTGDPALDGAAGLAYAAGADLADLLDENAALRARAEAAEAALEGLRALKLGEQLDAARAETAAVREQLARVEVEGKERYADATEALRKVEAERDQLREGLERRKLFLEAHRVRESASPEVRAALTEAAQRLVVVCEQRMNLMYSRAREYEALGDERSMREFDQRAIEASFISVELAVIMGGGDVAYANPRRVDVIEVGGRLMPALARDLIATRLAALEAAAKAYHAATVASVAHAFGGPPGPDKGVAREALFALVREDAT